jgi:hydroxypyruvate reductase/glycerate 2-kinase
MGSKIDPTVFVSEFFSFLDTFNLQTNRSVYTDKKYVILCGKAVSVLLEGIPEENKLVDGLVISNQKPNLSAFPNLQFLPASHPFPDKNSLAASLELRDFCTEIPEGATVLLGLTGGTSSMLALPPGDIEIEDLAEAYRLLLDSGMNIRQMNSIRKKLCELKGGKLAELLAHCQLTSVYLSDVPGDDPAIIGSGPTVPDDSTFEDALSLCKDFGIWTRLPDSVRVWLEKAPKSDPFTHPHHDIQVFAPAAELAAGIGDLLKSEGYHVRITDEAYSGSSLEIAKQMSEDGLAVLSGRDELKKPAALVYFGESYPEVTGRGKGGRNQELALMCALMLEGQHSIQMLSLATDGIDGPTDAAGAIITSRTTLEARKKGLSPEEYLKNNDSYHFHEAMDSLIFTGPTGRNFMDLQVILVE